MKESIERLKKYIKASREFYKKFKLENITLESEIGLDQDIEKVINRLEQDERIIDEMAEEIIKIFYYEGEYSPKYIKDSIKETQRCMMDYFIRKCE